MKSGRRAEGGVMDVGNFTAEPFSQDAACDHNNMHSGNHRYHRCARVDCLVTGYRLYRF